MSKVFKKFNFFEEQQIWYCFIHHCRYLVATREEDGKMMGFAHFRYDMDFDDEVLYVYEIQLEEEFQRKGLGRFMMQVLLVT